MRAAGRTANTAFRFRDYAAPCSAAGRPGELWITVNEPWVAHAGPFLRERTPGWKDGGRGAGRRIICCWPTAWRWKPSTSWACGARPPDGPVPDASGGARAGAGGRIGAALDIHAYAPASSRPEDAEAVARARALEARWFLEPLAGMGYPEGALAWYEAQGVAPRIEAGDLETISRPLDFLGSIITAATSSRPTPARPSSGTAKSCPAIFRSQALTGKCTPRASTKCWRGCGAPTPRGWAWGSCW